MSHRLTHRRRKGELSNSVKLFASSGRNIHYGRHVWTVNADRFPLADECADLIRFTAEYYSVDNDKAAGLVNPPDIVSDAGAWDDSQFVSDLWHALEPIGYRTSDGAVVLDAEAAHIEYLGED